MSKPKKKHVDSSHISMSINGAYFEASGTSAEVTKKLKVWLDEVFRPLRTVRQQLAEGRTIKTD